MLHYSSPKTPAGFCHWRHKEITATSRSKIITLKSVYLMIFEFFHFIYCSKFNVRKLQLGQHSKRVTRKLPCVSPHMWSATFLHIAPTLSIPTSAFIPSFIALLVCGCDWCVASCVSGVRWVSSSPPASCLQAGMRNAAAADCFVPVSPAPCPHTPHPHPSARSCGWADIVKPPNPCPSISLPLFEMMSLSGLFLS